LDPAQRIIALFCIGLAQRRHCQLDADGKLTSAARREFSFPCTVDVHCERGDEHNTKENMKSNRRFKAPNRRGGCISANLRNAVGVYPPWRESFGLLDLEFVEKVSRFNVPG
jgi:hypothetical protein